MFDKRPSDYRKFRIALHVDFDDISIQNIDNLRYLMQTKGYHLTGKYLSNKSKPTDKQLSFAWDELKKELPIEPQKAKEFIYVKSYSYRRGKKIIHVKSYRRKYNV